MAWLWIAAGLLLAWAAWFTHRVYRHGYPFSELDEKDGLQKIPAKKS